MPRSSSSAAMMARLVRSMSPGRLCLVPLNIPPPACGDAPGIRMPVAAHLGGIVGQLLHPRGGMAAGQHHPPGSADGCAPPVPAERGPPCPAPRRHRLRPAPTGRTDGPGPPAGSGSARPGWPPFLPRPSERRTSAPPCPGRPRRPAGAAGALRRCPPPFKNCTTVTLQPLPSARRARPMAAVVLPLPSPQYRCTRPRPFVCSIIGSAFLSGAPLPAAPTVHSFSPQSLPAGGAPVQPSIMR